MTQPPLAVATDYSAAMIVARHWKNRLVAVLLLFLLAQIGAFVAVRLKQSTNIAEMPTATSPSATTAPASQTPADIAAELVERFAWLINVIDFLSIVAIATLCAVLLLLVGIMLVGRLVGVSYLTGAFMWCVVLAVMLFPWQALWDYSSAAMVSPAVGVPATSQPASTPEISPQVWPRFGLPGILYTWPKLKNRSHFTNERSTAAFLGWARFVGWPAVAIILLLVIQRRSGMGLKLALGERQIKLPESNMQPS